jgi:ribosomal-protein-alanine acetyltransferase/2-amino-4-hydroxy-6-hydroxymethyldihydropteridine diphosphokinase
LQNQDINNYIVFLGIGSNLGDREKNLEQAISSISQHPKIKFLKKSTWRENPAIEEAGPEMFLNGVIKISTSLPARELLDFILLVERTIDPERDTRGRKKSRKIDIDILRYGELYINEKDLVIPHPRMLEREFVMIPLNEIEAQDYSEEILLKANINEDLKKLVSKCQKKIQSIARSNQNFSIRLMALRDIDQVYAIHREAFGETIWSRDALVKELDMSYAIYYVAYNGDMILGFVGLWFVVGEMQIHSLAVDKRFRNKKIAETLIAVCIDTALENESPRGILDVRESNIPAQNLYKKFNFKQVGIRKQYYPDKENALLLSVDNFFNFEFLENYYKLLETLAYELNSKA